MPDLSTEEIKNLVPVLVIACRDAFDFSSWFPDTVMGWESSMGTIGTTMTNRIPSTSAVFSTLSSPYPPQSTPWYFQVTVS
jgi:hypothetical protein